MTTMMTKVHILTPIRTVGLSPKVAWAACLPAVGAVLAVLAEWAITGTFDRVELLTAAVGLIGAGLSAVGVVLGAPGKVEVEVPVVKARARAAVKKG